MPKLYIDEFVGISNRLETLPLAFAIRKAYGHDIVLDWHELDSFRVDDTNCGKVNFFAKRGAVRLRDCTEAEFSTLGNKKILLRSLSGPDHRLDPIYLEVARKLHLAPALVRHVKESFLTVAGRPLVGVHIRHGDFTVAQQLRYQVDGVAWPAVPLWWYERTMASLVARQKDICFFLACTGDPTVHSALHRNFDVISLKVTSSYHYKGPSHGSLVHPVADLFALACCPVMLATPISGYSHWAANVLGGATTCIVPLPEATPDMPLAGVLRLYGKRLPVWRAAGRDSSVPVPLDDTRTPVDLSQTASTEWL
jgi:hypothetical protein